jgi:conjugal transfer mating pair stabilization protein TraN
MKKTLASFLAVLLMLEPFVWEGVAYRALGKAFSYALPVLALDALLPSRNANAQTVTPPGVAEGKAMAQSSMNFINAGNLPTIDGSRTTITMPSAGGVTAVQSDLIQQRNAATTDAPATTFGNEGAYDSLVNSVTTRVSTEPSTQGDAYRIMMNSRRRRADYTEATFLDNSKTILSTPFTGCTQTPTTIPSSGTPYTLDDLQTCTRVVNDVASCHVERLYTIQPPPVAGDASYVSNTSQTTIWSPGGRSSGTYVYEKLFSIDWTKISTVILNQFFCDDGCVMEYRDNDTSMPWTEVPATDFAITLTPFTDAYGFTYPPYMCGENGRNVYLGGLPRDIAPYIRGITNLRLRVVHCVRGGGGAYAQITWNSNANLYVDNGFLQQPMGCWDKQFSNSYCHADSWTCNDSSVRYAGPGPIDINMIKSVGGKEIWQDNTPYVNPAFEGSAACFNADATGLCNFGGPTACFIDVQGNQQCPSNTGSGAPDACQALEARGCIFDSEVCIPGAIDANTGTCMAYNSTYRCGGTTVDISHGGSSMSMNCAATRCMGSECTDISDEHNSSFSMVNGLLGNFDALSQDKACDASGCILFKGKNLQCKVALGGLFDCCSKSMPGVNWMDYLKLAHASYKAANMSGIIGELPSVSGIAEQIGNSAISTINDLAGKQLISPMDAVESASGTGSGPLSALITELQNKLTTQMYEYVLDNFGPDVAGSLFTETAAGSGVFTLAPEVTELMSTIGAVFMWIYVAYLVLSIIFACTNDEFELAADKQLRACHHIGSYCSGSFLGICYETKESYCCYGSALSRILQEQIRMQMYGWGTPESPLCGGLTTGDLAVVDWSRVNLDEYVAMLTLAGMKPPNGQENAFYGMDNLTKVNVGGSSYSTDRGTGSIGVNAVDTLQQASGSNATTGVSIDTTRSTAVQNATSSFPP